MKQSRSLSRSGGSWSGRGALIAVLGALALGACSTTPLVNVPAPVTELKAGQAAMPEARLNLNAAGRLTAQGTPAWAGGTSAWAGGTAAWAGGTSAWAGGTAAWAGATSVTMGDNALTWGNIKLQDAQLLAPQAGAGVIVAVLDTGVDATHPALAGRLVPGYDFVSNDSDPSEVGTSSDAGYGHGTGVAGVIAQVAPNAKIMPLRVLDQNGIGDSDNIAAAIRYAVAHGAQVINMSLGTHVFDCALQSAVAGAVKDNLAVFVAAAGNAASSNVHFPAATSQDAPHVYFEAHADSASIAQTCADSSVLTAEVNRVSIGIGATDPGDVLAPFSNYGDGVKMVAPGMFIATAFPEARKAMWSGTSFAAPLVSGAIALALGEKPTLDAAKLASSAAASADDVSSLTPSLAGQIGSGRLDVPAFLKLALQ